MFFRQFLKNLDYHLTKGAAKELTSTLALRVTNHSLAIMSKTSFGVRTLLLLFLLMWFGPSASASGATEEDVGAANLRGNRRVTGGGVVATLGRGVLPIFPSSTVKAGPALRPLLAAAKSSTSWTVIANASTNPSVSIISAFATQAWNSAEANPPDGSMGMVLRESSVLSARYEPAGNGGLLWELVARVSKGPNCNKPDMACPMYIMMGQEYWLVYEDRLQALTLVTSQRTEPGDSLASPWTALNLKKASSLAQAHKLALWAANPQNLVGVSHSAKVLSAQSQLVPSFGTMYQLKAEITTAPVVRHPPPGVCNVHVILLSVVNRSAPDAVSVALGGSYAAMGLGLGLGKSLRNVLWQNSDLALAGVHCAVTERG